MTLNMMSSSNLDRSEILSLVDELSRVSDKSEWSKPHENGPLEWTNPHEMEEIKKMAELAPVTGYCALESLMDTSVARQVSLYRTLLSHRGASARVMRKKLDS